MTPIDVNRSARRRRQPAIWAGMYRTAAVHWWPTRTFHCACSENSSGTNENRVCLAPDSSLMDIWETGWRIMAIRLWRIHNRSWVMEIYRAQNHKLQNIDDDLIHVGQKSHAHGLTVNELEGRR